MIMIVIVVRRLWFRYGHLFRGKTTRSQSNIYLSNMCLFTNCRKLDDSCLTHWLSALLLVLLNCRLRDRDLIGLFPPYLWTVWFSKAPKGNGIGATTITITMTITITITITIKEYYYYQRTPVHVITLVFLCSARLWELGFGSKTPLPLCRGPQGRCSIRKSWIYHVMWLLPIIVLIRWLFLNERMSNNNHLIGQLPKIITSRESCQSPINDPLLARPPRGTGWCESSRRTPTPTRRLAVSVLCLALVSIITIININVCMLIDITSMFSLSAIISITIIDSSISISINIRNLHADQGGSIERLLEYGWKPHRVCSGSAKPLTISYIDYPTHCPNP